MADLAAYLRAEAARRFEFGCADCATFAADWVRARHGVDPMAQWRGYRDQDGAQALLAGWGGLIREVGRGMRRAGFRITGEPRAGDIAVVAFGGTAACAIRGARGWALRLEGGLALLPADRVRVIAAWRV